MIKLKLKPQKTNMETRQAKYITENSLRETLEIGLNPLFGTHGYQLYSISKVHNISKCIQKWLIYNKVEFQNNSLCQSQRKEEQHISLSI